MSWQAASFLLLALALAAGFALVRARAAARARARAGRGARGAGGGGAARLRGGPNVKPTTDIVLFAGYALGAVPGFAVGAVTAIVSNIFLSQGPWTVWQMAGWGAVGVGGRAARPGAARTRAEPLPARGGLRTGGPRVRRVDGRLPVDARGAPGPRLLPGGGGELASLQPRPRDRQRRLLPADRPRLHPRAAALPAPPRGALAAPAGAAATALCCVVLALVTLPAVAGAATPAERAERYLLRAQNADGASARRRARHPARSTAAGRALGLAAAGRNPRDVARRGGRSLAGYVRRGVRGCATSGRSSARSSSCGPRASTRAASAGATSWRRSRRNAARDGSIAGFVSYTAFGVLALRAAGEPAGRPMVALAARQPERRRRLRGGALLGQRQRHDRGRRSRRSRWSGGPAARRRAGR